jgi:hypothetical protein
MSSRSSGCSVSIYEVEVEVELNLRPTVSRPVCLGAGIPPGTHDQIYFISLTIASFLCGAPSLTRGLVCNLLVQLLLGSARAVTLGSKPCRTLRHIVLSHLRLTHSGGPGPRIYIPQKQGGPVIPPGTGFPFCHLAHLAGLQWQYSNPPPHGLADQLLSRYLFMIV